MSSLAYYFISSSFISLAIGITFKHVLVTDVMSDY